MAEALATAGLLREYVTTFVASDHLGQVASKAPEFLSRYLERGLALRPMPPRVPHDLVYSTAVPSELLRVAAFRFASHRRGIVEGVGLRAAERFDRASKTRLSPLDAVFVGSYMHAADSLGEAARIGVATLLDYPLAHHDFAERLLREEALLQPDYAPTLQLHALHPRLRARMDAELRLADRILTVSSFQRRTFLEAGISPGRLAEAPFGVDADAFRPATDPYDAGEFQVLFCGQLSQRKGLSYAIDGFLQAAIPNSQLTLLGRRTGRVAPWRDQRAIHELPAVPHPELPDYYRKAAVFLLPSLIEGLPQTALEAMASGLPVIVSDNTFGEGVITDGTEGFVVPIRDSGAIAERLRYLHANPDMQKQMGDAARRRAQQFSWESYHGKVVRAVTELI